MFTCQRGLAGGKACRWYINEYIPQINILRASLLDHFEPIAVLRCLPLSPCGPMPGNILGGLFLNLSTLIYLKTSCSHRGCQDCNHCHARGNAEEAAAAQ